MWSEGIVEVVGQVGPHYLAQSGGAYYFMKALENSTMRSHDIETADAVFVYDYCYMIWCLPPHVYLHVSCAVQKWLLCLSASLTLSIGAAFRTECLTQCFQPPPRVSSVSLWQFFHVWKALR